MKNDYEEIKDCINKILKTKDYIIFPNQKIDKNEKKEFKKNSKKFIVTKADYVYLSIIEEIDKIIKFKTEYLYEILSKDHTYVLYDLKFILDSALILRKPYLEFFKFMSNLNGIKSILGLSIIIVLFNNTLSHPFMEILVLILFLISIYIDKILIPKLTLNINYFLFIINMIIKERQEDINPKDQITILNKIAIESSNRDNKRKKSKINKKEKK